MAKKTYAAMFEPADGGYGISFPDLPGCVSFGADLDACMRQAHEALTLHLEGMAEDGEVAPDATPLRDLVARMDNPPGHVWASIEVEAPDAAERVNVYLPRSLLDRVDRYVAERAPMNRSTFFTEAARARLDAESYFLRETKLSATATDNITQEELSAGVAVLGAEAAARIRKALGPLAELGRLELERRKGA